MQSKSPFPYILGTLLLFVCILIGFGVFNDMRPNTIDPSQGSIPMIEPCGWPWCLAYDSQYAQEVNKPNSEANRNNGQANLFNAQATKTVNEAEYTALESQMARDNHINGTILALCSGLGVLLFLGFLGASIFAERYTKE